MSLPRCLTNPTLRLVKVQWKRTGETDFVTIEKIDRASSDYLVGHQGRGLLGRVLKLNTRWWGSQPRTKGSIYRKCSRQDAVQFLYDVSLGEPAAMTELNSIDRAAIAKATQS